MADQLPQDIIVEILSRLPVKSLMRFKCVCKPWLSLISHPDFARLHLNLGIRSGNHQRLLTMFPFYSTDYESPSSLLDGVVDDDDAIVNLGFPLKAPQKGVEIGGTCNGLVCIVYEPGCMIIWNPSIRSSRELPELISSLPTDIMSLYGIGYDSSIDDYKAVRGVWSSSNDPSGETRVEVFSLKNNNSWRLIRANLPNDVTILEEVGTYVNGALHWRANYGSSRRDNKKRDTILTLDLTTERFGEIPQPKSKDRNVCFHTLGVSEGCLSLLSYGYGLDVEIWEMKEYGEGTSWMKVATIHGMEFGYCDYLVPICFTRNGHEVVIDVDGRKLIRYDLKKKTSRDVKVLNEDGFEWALYVESLISPWWW